MSGPEWTHEPDPNRVEPRPLSPEDAYGARSVPPFQAQVQAPEPAMTPDHPDSDPDETDPAESPAPARKWFGFSLPSLKLPKLSSLLGSERHEVLPDPPRASAPDQPEPEPAGATPRKVPAIRFPWLSHKLEARVGIAALLSFAFLVTAFVVKKGWAGRAVTVSIPAVSNDKAGASGGKDRILAAGPKPSELPKPDPEPTPPVPNLPLPTGEGTRPAPRTAPAESPPPRDRLANDPQPAEPASPPSAEAEALPPASLANNDPPPTMPSGSPATPADPPGTKPIEVPSGPSDPIALPGDPTTTPSPSPAPESTAPGLPEIPAAPKPPEPGPATPLSPEPSTVLPPIEPMPGGRSDPPPAPATPAPATPAMEPPPSPAPAPAPKVEPSAPVRAAKAPTLESVPTASPGALAAESPATLGAGWVVIPSGGKRIPGNGASSPAEPEPTASPIRDGPRPREDASGDQFEPVVHRVQPGENFWTISRTFYRSGRYYKALHAANARQVPRIDGLEVGTVLRIPPPEELDRSLILPATGRPQVADESTGSKVTRTSRRDDSAGDIELALPSRPPVARPDPELADEPRRPTYTVKPHDTLRSIARQTLNDSTRDREILGLNRDAIDDPKDLAPGTTLILPADAVIGRRPR